MYLTLLALTGALWFALLCPAVLRTAGQAVPPLEAPVLAPFVLVAAASLLLFVFNVPRDDGTAVLEQGLSASNVLSVAATGLTALYLLWRAILDPRVLRLPFAPAYLPFTLMVLFNAASALWSVVPGYTLFRAGEVGVLSLATMLIVDRRDLRRQLGHVLSAMVLAWLAVQSPTVLGNLSHGIVFSAGKDNMMPLVAGALVLFALFESAAPHRWRDLAVGLVGFVIAGSAASTGALLCALGPAVLLASRRPSLRLAGGLLAAAVAAVFVIMMLGLSSFPVLLDLASTVLQKPAVELANATGRAEFWPTFLAATQDHVFGSGFSAADRFIQLLIPTGDLAQDIGQQALNYSSAHNMYLSAWAGTGVIGLCFCALVLGSAIRRALRLDKAGRRFALAVIFMLMLNGMTTPGIFQNWTANTFAFVAVLGFLRIEGRQRAERVAPLAPPRAGRMPAARPARILRARLVRHVVS